MLPNIYRKMEELPYNKNGKIDRQALKKMILGTHLPECRGCVLFNLKVPEAPGRGFSLYGLNISSCTNNLKHAMITKPTQLFSFINIQEETT